ncbi:plastocyanin/azurin family copper-binding protein [Halobacteriaceae archaeon GCM10025711]
MSAADATTRRRFLATLGGGTVATAGFAGTAAGQEPVTVRMGNNFFDPVGLHVQPGDTVRFELAAGAHSATAYPDRIPDGAEAFDSGVISEGAFEHTFDVAGTYDYYCIPHEGVGMVGRIVVGEPGGPAEQSPIPHGEVPDSDTIVAEGSAGESGSSTGGSGMPHGGMGPGMGGMGGGRGFGGWWLFGPLGALGLLAVPAAIYWLANRDDGGRSPEATLRERYARGEIDEDEFERRRSNLDERE